MASKHRNMFYQNKKQGTTEIGTRNLPSFFDDPATHSSHPRPGGLPTSRSASQAVSSGALLGASGRAVLVVGRQVGAFSPQNAPTVDAFTTPSLEQQHRNVNVLALSHLRNLWKTKTCSIQGEILCPQPVVPPVREWTRAFIPCQKSKVGKHTVATIGVFPTAGWFEHIHLGIIGPLPPSQGKVYCLTMTDRKCKTKNAATSNKVDDRTPTVYTIPEGSPYAEPLQQFPDITRPGSLHREVRRLVRHHTKTTGPSVVSRTRTCTRPPRRSFSDSLQKERVALRAVPGPSPLHIVQKADGSYRLCGDYRRLNTQTIPDRHAVPDVLDVNINVHDATVFSTIDLERAYYQIPVTPENVQKTAVITPFGLFKFTRMSFGLRQAAQTLQRFIDSILFKSLSSLLGVRQCNTTAYHPQSNK
ncbi:hypothetical protein AAG570_006227 [Ranatra chinensis]|uniref:Reverse transcriptase domain-containing protein n=1 Tax=Ranatra chinensis TaxID=642074 RepID=A0ABD0YTG4_9HEMI